MKEWKTRQRPDISHLGLKAKEKLWPWMLTTFASHCVGDPGRMTENTVTISDICWKWVYTSRTAEFPFGLNSSMVISGNILPIREMTSSTYLHTQKEIVGTNTLQKSLNIFSNSILLHEFFSTAVCANWPLPSFSWDMPPASVGHTYISYQRLRGWLKQMLRVQRHIWLDQNMEAELAAVTKMLGG